MGGVFIVLEGPDGSGKSTQARRLAERLRATGREVLLTREPGGTAIGEEIRTILLDRDNYAMLAETEALLHSAARAQHVGEVIRPALERGCIVVCDRFADSTLAYQGGGRGLPIAELRAVERLATGGLTAHLRLLLDLPVELGLRRRFGAGHEVNRLDLAEIDFHRRVRETYLDLARSDPQRWVVVNASDSIDSVTDQIVWAVETRLGLRVDP